MIDVACIIKYLSSAVISEPTTSSTELSTIIYMRVGVHSLLFTRVKVLRKYEYVGGKRMVGIIRKTA